MPNPDVRVKLSAEGVAEVVAALRRIQGEAAKTGRGGAKDFLALNNTLGSLEKLAAAAAAAVATIGLARLGKNAVDAAEDMQNLSSRFGTSVRDLSAMDVALRRMGSSLKDQSRALTTFFEKTQDAAQLGGEAADVFARLHMDPKQIEALAGKDLAGRLVAVAEAFKKMPEGPERTAAAIAALGTRGASLIPLLEEIGDKGMAGLYDQANRLSALLNGDVVDSVGALNDAFDDISIQSQGLATSFMAGFATPMVAAIHAVTGELKTSEQFWHDIGSTIGEVLGRISVEVAIMSDAVHTRLLTLSKNIASYYRGWAAALTGNFSEAQVHWESLALRREKDEEDLGKRAELARRRFNDRTKDDQRKQIGEEEEQQESAFDRLAKMKNAARKAQADADIRIAREVAKAREAAEQRSFETGLLTVEEYYQRRRAAAVSAINDEIAALLRQRLAASRGNDPKDAAEVAKVSGEIRRLQVERSAAIARLNGEEAEALKKLATAQLGFEKELRESQGRRHEAALLGIEQEIAKRAEEFQNLPEGQRAGMLAELRGTLELQEQFNVAQDAATAALADFGRERDAITRRVEAGLLSEVEGEGQIAALENERILRLRALGAELLHVAEASGDPERITQARQFLSSVDEIQVAVDRQRSALLELRAGFGDALRGGVEEFFRTAKTETGSLADYFENMARSILNSLGQIIDRLIATKVAMAVLRFIPGGAAAASGGGGSIGEQASDVFFGSEGGPVPGVGQGDTVPAMLTPGEYVVRAARVAAPGVYSALEQLNRGMVSVAPLRALRAPQRLADGGLVGGPAGASPLSGRLTLGLAEGLTVREMDTPAGHRVIIRALSENPKAASAALRGA